jgi:hypothetical protein
MEEITVIMVFEKSTKNTHKYAEQEVGGESQVLRTLYLAKDVAGSSPPAKLEVTINEID